jgi:hypothetical protein
MLMNLLRSFLDKLYNQLNFSTIFPTSFWQRLGWYLFLLLPCAGILVHKTLTDHFNIDEFQHSYLAWSTVHFDQIQYRDVWDNHGILYTLFNAFFIWLLAPEPGIYTIFLERYLNLGLLFIGFIVLLEIFYLLNKKPQYCALGLYCFCWSFFYMPAIQVRPDNLQCLFLYLGIWFLTKAYQSEKIYWALIAGLSTACMLMTNLKSVSALAGICLGIFIAFFVSKKPENNFRQDIKIAKIFLNFIVGVSLGLSCFALAFYYYGILDHYYYCNVAFNYHYMKYINNNRFGPPMEIVKIYQNSVFFWTLQLIAIGVLLKRIYKKQEKNFFFLLIIISIYLICMFNRLRFYFWNQYDLLMMPMMFCATSYLLCDELQKHVQIPKDKQKKIFFISILILFISAFFQLFCKNFTEPDPYFSKIQTRFVYVRHSLAPGEHVESFCPGNCSGLGFTPHAGKAIQKDRALMDSLEKAYNKKLFSDDYIKLLNNKKVRLIISTQRNPYEFEHEATIKYIKKNYKPYDCIWERITPFEAEM